MLRNLLYSLSLHLFVFLLLYSDTILYGAEKPLDLLANQKIDIDTDKLHKIKNHLFNSNKLQTLTLKQKIDLYKNYDKIKSIKTAKYNEIKNKLKDNIIFPIKENIDRKTKIAKNNSISKNNQINNNYNIITKEHHKVYIKETELTKEQIKKINKQNELKEKIREQIKISEDILVKKENNKKQLNLDDVLNNLDKELVTISNKTKQESKTIDTNNKNNDNNNISTNLKEIADLIKIDDIDKLIKAKDNITDSDVYTIFTKEDYNVMSQTKSSIYELSFRERSNIQKQINTCYKNSVLKTQKNSSIIMSARITLDKNGQIDMKNITFGIEEENINNVDKDEYFTTMENIKLALVYCNPLRGLPSYKYNIWKNMNLIFNN